MLVLLPFIFTLGATAPVVINTVIVTQTYGANQNLQTAQTKNVQTTPSPVQASQIQAQQTASTSSFNIFGEIAQLFGFGSTSEASNVANTSPAAVTATSPAVTTTPVAGTATPTPTTFLAISSIASLPSSESPFTTTQLQTDTPSTQTNSASSAIESSQSSNFVLDEAVSSTPQSGNAYLTTVNKICKGFGKMGNGIRRIAFAKMIPTKFHQFGIWQFWVRP